MFYTDDPLADHERHEAEQERWLAKRPDCADCGEAIQEESAYYIGGNWICERCVESYRRDVEPEY